MTINDSTAAFKYMSNTITKSLLKSRFFLEIIAGTPLVLNLVRNRNYIAPPRKVVIALRQV